jgi:lipoyl(octanoyl) transferase
VPDYLAAEWQLKLKEAAEEAAVIMADGNANRAAAARNGSNSTATATHGTTSGNRISPGAGSQAGSSSSTSNNTQINELWREKICEWCYQVVDHFDFNREVVSVTMSYLDRYLATRTVNRRIFQLAAMTALYLAIKLFEPGKLRMSSLIDLSRGYFMSEHIVTMEDSMLQSLKWHVHPPTPLAYCRDFMGLVSSDIHPVARHDVNELARFMTELSVCDYWFVTKKPSSIALASLINAMELQGPRRIENRHKMEFLSRVAELGMDITNDDEIVECYERLAEMYRSGGYSPNLEDSSPSNPLEDDEDDEDDEDGSSARDARVATISPTGVADGPDVLFDGTSATTTANDNEEEMECA